MKQIKKKKIKKEGKAKPQPHLPSPAVQPKLKDVAAPPVVANFSISFLIHAAWHVHV